MQFLPIFFFFFFFFYRQHKCQVWVSHTFCPTGVKYETWLLVELQSWKKRLGQFVRFASKNLPPPFPQCNVDPSHVARGRARSPNIDWWGWGRVTNGELGCFFKTMHCPKCPYNREHRDNCNKVDQVSQLFFSRIVWAKSKSVHLKLVFWS